MASSKNQTPPAELDYGADEIHVLEGLEPVRRRPGMYIGGTSSKGLTHLVREIVDNSVDEALAGHCTQIEISMSKDSVVTVVDNGRGIPVGMNKAKGTAAVHLVFEVLHAGSKFGDGGYAKSGGLHGVGASVTNALSSWLNVEVRRDGKLHQVKYADAQRVQDCKVIGKATDTGTTVSWKYDESIFDKGASYDVADLEEQLQQKAYLVPGLKIIFAREGHKTRTFYSKEGIRELIALAADEREPLHKALYFSTGTEGITVNMPGGGAEANLEVDVAMAWTKKADDRTYSFANIIPTPDHGTHVTGFRGALTKAFNNYAYETGKLKKDGKKPESFEGRDITAALTAAVLVKLAEPQFEGQTKGKLNNSEARTAVQTFLYASLTDWLNDKKNATAAKAILDRCLHARKYRLAEDKVDKNFNPNSIFADTGQSEKLADVDLKNTEPEERELFIVEGDSAGGTAIEARNSRTQAILPLRGKPLNVLTANSDKVTGNEEIKALVSALGGRTENVEGELVVSLPRDKRRYGKIVTMSDADADGAHITALIIGVIAELMPDMIREGRVFMSRPPLFKINLDKRGNKFVYAYTEEERSALMAKHKRGSDDVTRFKGLGEMNAENLEETVMNPATRTLYQITVSDVQAFDQTLSLILGAKSGAAARRKAFLEDEAIELLEQDRLER
jgi:DNA gyrase subunit B